MIGGPDQLGPLHWRRLQLIEHDRPAAGGADAPGTDDESGKLSQYALAAASLGVSRLQQGYRERGDKTS